MMLHPVKSTLLFLSIFTYGFGQSSKKLNSELPPSGNFDLSSWALSIPSDIDNNGKPDKIFESELSTGYENEDYFFTGEDGGLVFKCPIKGAATSKNSRFSRVELREMLRNGDKKVKKAGVNKNNWVFSSTPRKDRKAAAAVDGEMSATVAINHVTTTGIEKQVGRVIIGQIHSNTDEPIRLYYRKLPSNKLGSIYFAHEINHEKDTYYEMIGEKSNDAKNPINGIALNEKFTYKIKVVGNKMWVTISRKGKKDVTQYVDMKKSNYDESGQYQYFKAGIYIGNDTGDADDYAQVTFYALEKSHTAN